MDDFTSSTRREALALIVGFAAAGCREQRGDLRAANSLGSPAPAPQSPADFRRVSDSRWASYQDGARILSNGVALRAQTGGEEHCLLVAADGEERYEIRADEHWKGDGEGTSRRRSELSGLTFPADGWVEFAYDLMVKPQSFSEDAQYVFGQAHKGRRDPGDAAGEHPISAFRILQGGRSCFTVSGSNAKPLTAADIVTARSVKVWTGERSDFSLGEWHRIRQVLMQRGDDSWAELWIDDLRKARHDGLIGYPNTAPPYWKRGVYNPQRARETCVCHYRNVTLRLV